MLNQRRYLIAENYFETIDIFEQRSSLGGLWHFTPAVWRGMTEVPQIRPDQPLEEPQWNQISCHKKSYEAPIFASPMYENLETNIPHFIMKFSDSPGLTEHQLCPSREAVLQYLREYASELNTTIQFQTQVTEVLQRTEEGRDSWVVHYRNLKSNEISKCIYDAVVVASGHHSVAYIPDIPGIREWNRNYPAVILHSKNYQRPQDFSDKKVLIIGYAASGRDIASQVAPFHQKPLIISHRSAVPVNEDTGSIQFMPEIVEFLISSIQERAVRFRNGHIETHIDAIIFCTGYLHSYPFLSMVRPPFISTGVRVQNLYQHIFSINHPSLAFVGLPKSIIPFPTCESQAAIIARVWSDRLQLPLASTMHEWEKAVLLEQGAGKNFHNLTFPKDIDYHNALVDWSLQAKDSGRGKLPKKWSAKNKWVRERCPNIKQAFLSKGEDRHRIMTMEDLDIPDYDHEPWILK